MTTPVRIPADVEMSDRVLGSLTARQLAVLAITGLTLYAAWTLTRPFLPIAAFLLAAAPVMAVAAALALGTRDGVSMDRLALAAVRQRISPRRYATGMEDAAPIPAWLADAVQRHNTGTTRDQISTSSPLPTRQVLRGGASADVGVVDLGSDGIAAVAAATTVNFALRTPDEQDGLVALFSRYLHSLTAPVQILARTHRLDLTDQIVELRAAAATLPDPALRAAALDHAEFLDELAHANLLRRQILVVLRESLSPATAAPSAAGRGSATARRTGLLGWLSRRNGLGDKVDQEVGVGGSSSARRAAESRLIRRLSEAIELLAPAGIAITPLTTNQAVAVLRTACNPDSLLPPTAPIAEPGHVITARATTHSHDRAPGFATGLEPERDPYSTDPNPDPGTTWDEEWEDRDDSAPDGRSPGDVTSSGCAGGRGSALRARSSRAPSPRNSRRSR